jgi:hypothetical protein
MVRADKFENSKIKEIGLNFKQTAYSCQIIMGNVNLLIIQGIFKITVVMVEKRRYQNEPLCQLWRRKETIFPSKELESNFG